jgi:carboxypeptidase Q
MHRFLFSLSIALIASSPITAQKTNPEDVAFIKQLYNKALTESSAYPWLYDMCTKIGGRMSGSQQAADAVIYTKSMLDTIHLSNVYLQSCMVPHWVRNNSKDKEVNEHGRTGDDLTFMINSKTNISLDILSLGNSVGTGAKAIQAQVIEVDSFKQLEKLGSKVKGKIVFFNHPMDPTQINTFSAYGEAVSRRVYGASEAAKYGALAVVVRSMTNKLDDYPHTGVMIYKDSSLKIPAVAISTNGAEKLSELIKKYPESKLYYRTLCAMLPDVESYNVVGEIKGSEFPNEIITVGGHLDSWDPAQGAQDDGAGCMQSMGVLQLFAKMGYKPKHTIRCVLFMNEENGGAGGRKYAQEVLRKGEKQIVAIESDEGGFTPRGFSFEAEGAEGDARFASLEQKLLPYFEPYRLYFKKGGSGSDIGPLRDQKTLLIGFVPDSQRYFDYHHASTDTIEAVSKRELELGTAAMASLIYLLDKKGF